MKHVVVVVTQPPHKRTAEKLRMAVGLTLEDGNRVSVVLMDDGVYAGQGVAAGAGQPEVDKSLETLAMLNVAVVADGPSVDERGLMLTRFNVKTAYGGEIDGLFNNADVIIH